MLAFGLKQLAKVNISAIDTSKLGKLSIKSNGQTPKGYASGGTTAYGGSFLVGQRGPQIIDLPKNTTVHSNSQSKNMTKKSGNTDALLTTIISKLQKLYDKPNDIYLDGRKVNQLLIKNKITY